MATKISDTTIEMEKVTPEVITPAKIEKVQYDRDFIENQIKAITAQRDGMIAEKESLIRLKEAELAECESILAEMDKLGIKGGKVDDSLE
jgi:hypothetical protein